MSDAFAIPLARKHLGKDFPETAWTTGFAILLLSPVNVVGNGLVLSSILLDPFKNIRRSPVNSLIFSLALADLLVGILVGPLMAYWLIDTGSTSSEPFSSNIVSSAAAVLMGVSYCSLVALSVDRRIAITTPLQYAYKVTKTRIRNVNVLIWCCFIIYETLTIVFGSQSKIFDIIYAAHSAMAPIILVIFNIAVVRAMSKQALNIKRTVGSENVVVIQNAFNREKVVTKTIFIISVVFQICSWPFIIIFSVTCGLQNVTDIFDVEIILWVHFVCIFLVCANSLMNPFLYAWRLPKYRKAFQHFLIQLRKRPCISHAQLHTNKSLQLSTTESKQNTLAPDSIKLSLPHHNNAIESSTTKQAVCNPTFSSSDIQEQLCRIDGHSTENTWL